MKLPWWYQPTASGDLDSMDRAVDPGVPIVPPQIEIRDGGIFWSYDPEGKIPRVNPFSDNTSQLLAQLRTSFAVMYLRRSKSSHMFEDDRILMMRYLKPGIRSAIDRRTLTDFLNLQHLGAEETLAYAKLHGVLDVCVHGLTHGHHVWCAPPGWPLEGWTSFELWRRTAQRFAAVLRISADLKESPRGCGRREDWTIVVSAIADEEARRAITIPSREVAFNMLQSVVNDFLRIGEVVPTLSRLPAGWKLRLTGNPLYPLFGNLATQLALIVCGAEAMFTCAGCGSLYMRQGAHRRPKRGMANYCSNCGRRGMLLSAKRRYTTKVSEARRLRSEGMSVSQIARQLQSDASKVRKWVSKKEA
jgi:hypothetical protein